MPETPMRGTEGTAPQNPLVAALLSGSAPLPLRLSAARGVLPLVKTELVRILVVLLADGEDQVRREAAARLASFAEQEILPILEDASAPVEALDHFGCAEPGSAALKSAVIANPATRDDTLRRMFPSMTAAQIDTLLLNQTRLIASPDLLDLLDASPALTAPQRTRVAETRRHFLTVVKAAEPVEAPVSADKPAPQAAESSAAGAANPGAAAAQPSDTELAALIANANMKIMKMNTSEKVQLAMKGTREERTILIKDASKTVQEAVLDSPKLTENEVEGFARMRSLPEDILRIISLNRDWMKNYTVVHALASNPKTPAGVAMTLISRLNIRDLKLLMGDKNVSEVIRRHARKVNDARTERPGH